jgi:hypothetical protein
MSAVWALRILRWTYCAYIAWASAQTLREGIAQHDIHAQILAGLELPAIAAFAWPRVEIVACAALLLIFGAAALITALGGELPLHLIFYGVVAVYIVYAHRHAAPACAGLAASVGNAAAEGETVLF